MLLNFFLRRGASRFSHGYIRRSFRQKRQREKYIARILHAQEICLRNGEMKFCVVLFLVLCTIQLITLSAGDPGSAEAKDVATVSRQYDCTWKCVYKKPCWSWCFWCFTDAAVYVCLVLSMNCKFYLAIRPSICSFKYN